MKRGYAALSLILSLVAWTGLGCLIYVSGYLIYVSGQTDVRQNTIVKEGVPHYRAVFYGECLTETSNGRVIRQACATDKRYTEEVGR